MIDLISAMSLVMVSWFLLFLLFAGLGLVVQRALGHLPTSGTFWLESFWLGWCLAILILQFWHFFAPVNDVIAVILSVIALILIFLHRGYLFLSLRKLSHYRVFMTLFFIALLWFANRAIDAPVAYDTGFRDIQAIMWIDTYPIIPGMNNLFSSLAFNQSYYLYGALLDFGVWTGRAHHIAIGLLYMAFLAQGIWGGIKLVQHRDGQVVRWTSIYYAVLVPYVFYNSIQRGAVSHFLTDAPVDLIGFLSMGFVLDFVQFYRTSSDHRPYHIIKIAILILTGFTLKQSFIIFGLTLGLLVLLVWSARGGFQRGASEFLRLVAWVLGYGLLLLIPWMARGVITSGYIAYPQSIGAFDVDWREPIELLEERQQTLATNTRIRSGDPDEILADWGWVIPWFKDLSGNVFYFSLPVLIVVVSLMLYGIGKFHIRNAKTNNSLPIWILLPIFTMFIVWFISAPNIKYVGYLIWILVAVCVILAVSVWHDIVWRWRKYGILLVIVAVFVYSGYLTVSLRAFPLPAGPEDGFYEHAMPPVKTFVTDSGLAVNTPDSHIKLCWNIPLPCTPLPRVRLYLRVPDDITQGFGVVPK